MTSSLNPNAPLRSVHTQSFHAVLSQLGLSLVVSTYQAGKLILMRADGNAVNTHFRVFDQPMGVAADREKIAVGTSYAIQELRNVPAVAEKIPPTGRHDGCYLPRRQTVTGDIDIHEMAWVDQDLWFINTRFSCLCTLDPSYSFVPRWRPPFITGYDLTDRCHLNGLGIRDDRPHYVTALGETDRPNGWRANKASGGILMDITTNNFIVRGLSMPHSPRWYRDRLWVLESGRGTLAQVDLATGTLTTVAALPGFTRGIDFWGDLAFIGLSQIRETAVFSGIPLTQTLSERICGVWVVNIISGEIVAFLKFEDAVQEIFAVSVLPGLRFPELIEHDDDLLSSSYVLPDAAMAEVVPLQSDQPSALSYFEQGCVHYQAGEREAAVTALQQCLVIQPDYLPARYNLGVVLGELERYDAAIAYLHQVIEADVGHAGAHKTLGHLYSQQNQVTPARLHYEQAVRINPQDAQAHYNLGMMCLALGDFETGWAECEWRWQTAEFTPFNCPQPRWQGQLLPDQTLLIHTEQGAGDAIQFVRYVSWAAARCQRVILVCPAALLPLFEKLPGVDQCQTPGQIALNAFDVYVPLMSLPYLAHTTVETIPASVPYLPADARRCPLPVRRHPHRVGIAWAGSPTHGNDRQRSTQLADWLPVLRVPEIEFVSLQKGQPVQALNDLPPDVSVQDLDPVLQDYADTASVVAQLDLVISVDTSVTHLAGALGRPCWTLLCYSPDWRWLTPRLDSTWYPTMRLFWQTQPGDWAGVLGEVAAALGHAF
ncbi:MAG: TIGR03032 family protein [Leptolyngbya sp. SIOISBB]|nr:TIGR03032 family protein [Leptolyngbya sp. SIOISBB]